MKIKFKDLAVCICGHWKVNHSNYYGVPICEGCANRGKGMEIYEHKFRQDNLEYLERLYEKKHS
jgi:hypothetical protein